MSLAIEITSLTSLGEYHSISSSGCSIFLLAPSCNTGTEDSLTKGGGIEDLGFSSTGAELEEEEEEEEDSETPESRELGADSETKWGAEETGVEEEEESSIDDFSASKSTTSALRSILLFLFFSSLDFRLFFKEPETTSSLSDFFDLLFLALSPPLVEEGESGGDILEDEDFLEAKEMCKIECLLSLESREEKSAAASCKSDFRRESFSVDRFFALGRTSTEEESC